MDAAFVFVNGHVFTADAARPRADAVAVGDGRIVALGAERDVLAAAGRDTEVVDLAGRMLLPGFQDAHVHPIHGGLLRVRCDLSGVGDGETAEAAIAEYAAGLPPDAWVLGGGWAYDWYERGRPDADRLERLTGGRPAHLVVRDGHSAWANRTALAVAGVTADTPDPSDGRIEREEDGSPQGTLHEGAMRLVAASAPDPTDDEIDRALAEGARLLTMFGITAWQDAWVTPRWHAAYLRARDRGVIRQTVRGALWWDRLRGLEQLDELEAMRADAGGGYEPRSVKLMLDGVCENFTASMLDPYHDGSGHPTAGRGIDFIDPVELREIVTVLHARGFQCHFHAIGDAAVRNALDAIASARAAHGPADLRHHVSHIQVVHPDDVPRFRRLGVVANCQALWAAADPAMTELTLPFLGPERGRWQYPFGSLRRTGAVLAMGSDWSVSTPDVMAQIGVAVTRVPHDRSGTEPFLPEEVLDLPAALTAFTAGSAYVNHLDRDRGTVALGKVADLTILGADPFDARDPGGIRTDLTMIGGAVVHERGA